MNIAVIAGTVTRKGAESLKGDVAKFTLGVRIRRKKDGVAENVTQYYDCLCFGKSASFALEYAKGGQPLCITGNLDLGAYISKAGEAKPSATVMVQSISFAPKAFEEKPEESPF